MFGCRSYDRIVTVFINRNGGHINPPLHEDYSQLKKKYGPEQAAKINHFRLMHLQEMIAVAHEEGILDKCNCREVDSLDVYYKSNAFEEAKTHLATWKKDMPKESEEYHWVEGKDAIEVLIQPSCLNFGPCLLSTYFTIGTEISPIA